MLPEEISFRELVDYSDSFPLKEFIKKLQEFESHCNSVVKENVSWDDREFYISYEVLEPEEKYNKRLKNYNKKLEEYNKWYEENTEAILQEREKKQNEEKKREQLKKQIEKLQNQLEKL